MGNHLIEPGSDQELSAPPHNSTQIIRRSAPTPIVRGFFLITCIISLANALSRSLPDGRLMDFGSFWDSGHAALAGENPYTWGPHTFIVNLGGKAVFNYNLNPPPSLLFFAPASTLDPDLIFLPFFAFSFALFLWLARSITLSISVPDRTLFFIWTLSLPALWDTLKLGQIYVLLASLTFLAYRSLDKAHTARSGLWIGTLVSIKPNFGAVLLFGNTQQWLKTACTSLAVLVLLNAISVSLFGIGVYYQWVGAVLNDISRLSFPTNVSIPGLAYRILGTPLTGLLTPVCLGGALYLLKNTKQLSTRLKIGLLVSILASPIGWIHYLLIALPLFINYRIDNLGMLIMVLYLAPISSVVSSYYEPTAVNTVVSFFYPAATLLLTYKISRDADY